LEATPAGSGDITPDPQFHGPHKGTLTGGEALPKGSTYFSAQSYLRYQGGKFIKRFDSNCYIAMTRKLDTHDVSRGRAENVAEALKLIEQPTLVLGIESDGLFTFAEQQELAEHIPNARLGRINSQEVRSRTLASCLSLISRPSMLTSPFL
jgi:homoserine O-acetyltransferase